MATEHIQNTTHIGVGGVMGGTSKRKGKVTHILTGMDGRIVATTGTDTAKTMDLLKIPPIQLGTLPKVNHLETKHQAIKQEMAPVTKPTTTAGTVKDPGMVGATLTLTVTIVLGAKNLLILSGGNLWSKTMDMKAWFMKTTRTMFIG